VLKLPRPKRFRWGAEVIPVEATVKLAATHR